MNSCWHWEMFPILTKIVGAMPKTLFFQLIHGHFSLEILQHILFI